MAVERLAGLIRSERIPIFGGRWQPFHNGHCEVLEQILAGNDRVICGVVNPDPTRPPDPSFDRFQPASNPLTYWQRVWMLTVLARARSWEARLQCVPMWHPRKSMGREDNYLPAQRRRVWYVPVVSESEEAKIEDFRELGEEVVAIEGADLAEVGVRATVVRHKLVAGDELWRSMVPPEIVNCLEGAVKKGSSYELPREPSLPIIAGRWQPLHVGHIWAIRQVIERHGEAVIGIVNADPSEPECPEYASFDPAHNPFTFWERLEMVTRALAEEDLLKSSYIVPLSHPRVALRRDEAFLPVRRWWVIPVTSAHEHEKIADLTQAGEDVFPLEVPSNLVEIASSTVRKRIADGDQWEDLVPRVVADVIRRVHGPQRIQTLAARDHELIARYSEQSLISRAEEAAVRTAADTSAAGGSSGGGGEDGKDFQTHSPFLARARGDLWERPTDLMALTVAIDQLSGLGQEGLERLLAYPKPRGSRQKPHVLGEVEEAERTFVHSFPFVGGGTSFEGRVYGLVRLAYETATVQADAHEESGLDWDPSPWRKLAWYCLSRLRGDDVDTADDRRRWLWLCDEHAMYRDLRHLDRDELQEMISVRRPRFAGHSGGQRDHAAAAASARRYSRASVGVR